MDRKQFLNINISTERVDKVYKINKEERKLGKGFFGIVVRGEDKVTGQARAIKIIKKEKLQEKSMNLELLSNEYKLMFNIDHPNIIRLFEVYDDAKYIYFVMELLEGNSLFEGMFAEGAQASEKRVRELFFQIMKGIQYLHKNGIAHRDIKPQNIMFLNKKMDQLKIIDFGVSKYFFDSKNPKGEITLRTMTGSLFYLPPEIMEGAYDCRCDIWSAGVLLYMMIAGVPPFYDLNPQIVVEKVKNVDYKFEEEVWKTVSPQVQDLIRNMIAPRDVRFDANQVLNHPWMKMDMVKPEFQVQLNAIKDFFKSSKISKLIREIISAGCSETDSTNMGTLFVDIDDDGDGLITRDELIEGISQRLKICDSELIEAIRKNFPENTRLSYTNFSTVLGSFYTMSNYEGRLVKIFSMLDSNQDGKLTVDDLIKYQKSQTGRSERKEDEEEETPEKKYASWISEVDSDKKGYLTFEDIKRIMKSKGC